MAYTGEGIGVDVFLNAAMAGNPCEEGVRRHNCEDSLDPRILEVRIGRAATTLADTVRIAIGLFAGKVAATKMDAASANKMKCYIEALGPDKVGPGSAKAYSSSRDITICVPDGMVAEASSDELDDPLSSLVL